MKNCALNLTLEICTYMTQRKLTCVRIVCLSGEESQSEGSHVLWWVGVDSDLFPTGRCRFQPHIISHHPNGGLWSDDMEHYLIPAQLVPSPMHLGKGPLFGDQESHVGQVVETISHTSLF